MLDIQYIRENIDKVKKAAKDKSVEIDVVRLIKLDDERRKLQQEIDSLRNERKILSKSLKDPKKRNPKLIEKGKGIKDKVLKIENTLSKVKEEWQELMLIVPAVPSSDTPVGKDENDNKVVREWGKKEKFSFKPKDHIALGRDLDILDLERGVKVAGFRGYFLKGDAVMLHLGILMLAIGKLLEKGFTLMIPPIVDRERVFINSGHFPFGTDENYQITNPGKLADGSEVKDKFFLAGTSEPPLVSFHQDEILKEKDLPLTYAGISPCFRSEVGSYGKDTKGIYRIHEFFKIEQVVLCRNDEKESLKWLEKMVKISEEVMQDLEIPHRVVQLCTGEMGEPQYKKYDIEAWMPSQKKYGETHSASAMLEFQSRRANVKYRDGKGETKYVHMLNNTTIASPRILIPLLENHQQKDGSIKIPKALQGFCGKEKLE